MATSAEGIAAIGRKPLSETPDGLESTKNTPRRKAAQTRNEIASSQSASVSCLRLSCQNTAATATKSSADGTTITPGPTTDSTFPTAAAARIPAATEHRTIQG